jgi:hypothetical protein
MNILRALCLTVVAGLVVFGLSACSDSGGGADSAPTADESFADGMNVIQDAVSQIEIQDPPWEWSVDMGEANAYFEDALDADPNHCGAQVMAAVTRLVMVLQDPELGQILEGLFPAVEGDRPGGSLFRVLQSPDVIGAAERLRGMERDGMPFSDLQDYIESEAIPALAYADDKMADFEDQDCVVVLEIEVEAARPVIEVEIDATDVYLLNAALDAVQTALYVAVSYNVDVEDGQTLQELVDEDPDFLSLRSGNSMPAALGELTELYEHLGAGAASMAAETDPQDTDIFTNTDDEGYVALGAGFADTLAMIADEIAAGLTSGLTVNPHDDLDESAPDMDILIDIAEMFTDPLDPITDYFPAHTWPDSNRMELTDPVDFPDPTMSGITPDMTDQRWGQLIDWMSGAY